MAGNLAYEINRGNTDLYGTWFGAYTSARYSYVQQTGTNVLNQVNKQMIFDCSYSGCHSDYFAFTYPTDSTHRLHLCQVFWTSPVGGGGVTETQAGTIVHELTHFTDIAGTYDWTYGETNVLALAKSTPSQAINNADNYAIFAERMY